MAHHAGFFAALLASVSGGGLATSYTMTQSASSGAVGSGDTLTFAPVGGVWPSGSIALTVTGGTSATIANGSGGSLSGTTLTPPAGTSTSCTVTLTPGTTGTGTMTTAATNTMGLSNPANVSYTVTSGGGSGGISSNLDGLPATLPSRSTPLLTSAYTSGLVAFQNHGKQTGSFGQDLVASSSGVFATPGNLTLGSTTLGQALVSTGTPETLPSNLFPSADCDFTMRWVFKPTNVSGFHCLLRTADAGLTVYIHDGQFEIHNAGNDHAYPICSASAGQTYDFLITKQAGSTQVPAYIAGALAGTAYISDGSSSFGVNNTPNIWGDQYNQTIAGNLHIFQAWNRILSGAEIAQVQSGPFTMLS